MIKFILQKNNAFDLHIRKFNCYFAKLSLSEKYLNIELLDKYLQYL